MKPVGVQEISPMRPPGRQTRTSSSAASWWCGSEHHADAGGHGVEHVVVVGQVLGVADLPLEADARGLGIGLALVEQLGREVAGDDVRPGRGGRDRDVAGSGGHVEHVVVGAEMGRLDEHGSEVGDDLGRDGVVVAERPHRAVARLQGGVGIAGGRMAMVAWVVMRVSLGW